MIAIEEIIRKIQEFASEISSQPLCQAQHQPEVQARPKCCFQNVWEKVAKDGGEILFGWTFSHRINPQYGDYVMATHHAVWCAPDNKLIDVTPFTDDPKHHPFTLGKYVLFLVDESAQPVEQGNLIAPLPLKYFALSNSQELKEYVNKLAEQEQKACQELYDGKITSAQISGIFFKT